MRSCVLFQLSLPGLAIFVQNRFVAKESAFTVRIDENGQHRSSLSQPRF